MSEQQRKIIVLLLELSREYGNLNEFEKQESTLDEIEKVNEDFNNVMAEVKEHLQSIRSERMTLSRSSLRSHDESSAVRDNNKDKEAELQQKQKEAKLRQQEKELDEMYQQEKLKTNQAINANTATS